MGASAGTAKEGGADRADAEEQWVQDWVVHHHFEEIDSTQSYVEREHETFAPDKLTAVSADFQTAGRGTRDRRWEASRGKSVLLTLFFRFPSECPTPFVNRNAPNVTKVLALAAVDTLKRVADGHATSSGSPLRFGIKWPNDVVVNNGKVGGILARAVPTGGRLDGVMLGIGVNINTPPADLDQIDRPVWPATSLHAATGCAHVYDVSEVRRRLIASFALHLRTFFSEGFSAFRERINQLEVLMGTQVRFRVHESNEVDGIFEGVDDDGLIILKLPSGETRSFPSGEIVPRPHVE